jgi:hypothetical protein
MCFKSNARLEKEVVSMTHLVFVEGAKDNRERKTKYFEVHGYKDAYLGFIQWNTGWRQYCFYPAPECVWSHDCLAELAEGLSGLNLEYKSGMHNPRDRMKASRNMLQLSRPFACRFETAGKNPDSPERRA